MREYPQLLYRNTGAYPRVGDRAHFLNETDILIVEDVIDSPGKMSHWNVEEPGLMLKGGMYGLVFVRHVSDDVEQIVEG